MGPQFSEFLTALLNVCELGSSDQTPSILETIQSVQKSNIPKQNQLIL